MAYNDYGNYRSGYSTGGVGAAYTDQWGNPRYGLTDEECITVIVDADGTKRTVVGCAPLHKPAETYVTTTETIIEERVHSPLLPSYRQSSHPGDEISAIQVRGYSYGADNDGYGYADQASRIAPSNWRQQPHQTGYYPGTTEGYDDYNGHSSNKPGYKHSGKTDHYDDRYRKSDSSYAPAVNMISNMVSNRAKPSRTTYSSGALPVRGDGRLTIPTDDMERALHYLKESAKTSPWPRT